MTQTIDTILGRAFASLSAEQQAEVLNAAGHYARRTFDSEWNVEMQGCRIAQALTDDGWFLLRKIAMFDPKVTP